MTVRTRFAPSPTGFLHIGGVRTALFNWLYARHHGGQFILRIDDTDQQRNVEESLAPILAGFRWLGMDWDEGPEMGGEHGPYFQSQRSDLYKSAVAKLLDNGAAYRDYSTSEELATEREAAQSEKRSWTYSRRWMADTEDKQKQFEAEGRASVVRLKMPREGTCAIDDLVRGKVEFPWSSENDHVIQRTDGSCLYSLASVVDDYEMQISHVIRAEEHLSNTPRQVFTAEALGYAPPTFAHLPYVAEPGSKNKLSKRKIAKYLKNPDFSKVYAHGLAIAERLGMEVTPDDFNPVLVEFYEKVGYLPDAIINYLLLLGWSLDDKTEEFTRDEMIKLFSLDRVNKSPASFDPAKLDAFQDRSMQRLDVKKKVAMVLPYLQTTGLVSDPPPCDIGPKIRAICEAAGDRIKTAGDILDHDCFFVADNELAYDEKAFEKRIRKPADAVDLLTKFKAVLATTDPFDAATLETTLKQFVENEEIKIGQIIHALRVAITGKAVGFGVFETLAILDQESCVARIERAIAII
jgi:glutamyl-tRNA synthetase